MKIRILPLILIVVLLASCKTQKNNLTYFENISEITDTIIPSADFNIKITPMDELLISINSLVPEATAAFNVPMVNPATKANILMTTQAQIQTFIVNKEGEIQVPTIGKIKVEGMTTQQLANYLTEKVS